MKQTYNNQKHYTFLITAIVTILYSSLQASVTVSYQPFEFDEFVINTNSWKFTTSDLQKQGLHPIKVVITNNSDNPETVILEKQSLQISNLLRHLAFWPGLKDTCKLCILDLFVGNLCDIIILGVHDPDWLFQTIKSSEYCHEAPSMLKEIRANNPLLSWLLLVDISLCLIPLSYFIYSRYRHYKELYSFLQNQIVSQAITIAPQTSISKIVMFDHISL